MLLLLLLLLLLIERSKIVLFENSSRLGEFESGKIDNRPTEELSFRSSPSLAGYNCVHRPFNVNA